MLVPLVRWHCPFYRQTVSPNKCSKPLAETRLLIAGFDSLFLDSWKGNSLSASHQITRI